MTGVTCYSSAPPISWQSVSLHWRMPRNSYHAYSRGDKWTFPWGDRGDTCPWNPAVLGGLERRASLGCDKDGLTLYHLECESGICTASVFPSMQLWADANSEKTQSKVWKSWRQEREASFCGELGLCAPRCYGSGKARFSNSPQFSPEW